MNFKRLWPDVKVWLVRVGIFVVTVIAVALLPAATVWLVLAKPSAADRTLPVLSLFLSTPYLTFTTVVLVVIIFREPLSQVISRGFRWKDLEFGGQRSAVTETKPPKTPSLDESRAEVVAGAAEITADESVAGDMIVAQLTHAMRWQVRAVQWKFYYLSFFLAPSTKLVLQWILDNPARNIFVYHHEWSFTIPDESQRRVMLEALITYGLVDDKLGGYIATEEGKAFHQFIQNNNAWLTGVPASPGLMEPINLELPTPLHSSPVSE